MTKTKQNKTLQLTFNIWLQFLQRNDLKEVLPWNIDLLFTILQAAPSHEEGVI